MAGKRSADEAVEDSKEFKRVLMDICIMFSVGAVFMVSSFIVPGITMRRQIICWQTAMIAFGATGVIIRRHPIVWYPVFLRLANRWNQKHKSERTHVYSASDLRRAGCTALAIIAAL
ncbi:hypothetical protein ACUV84_002257 [Puccinellia chinampoensis]